jgi:F-type H+-transporting ATPase subunit gamma
MVKSKDLLRRLTVFTKFMGIAKAIQMVAITKLKKLESVISTRQLSINTYKELFMVNELKSFSFLRNKKIILPITSDKQCCGIINSRVLGATLKVASGYKKEKHDTINIFVLGTKGSSGLARLDLSNDILGKCDNFKSELLSIYTIYIIFLNLISHSFDRLIVIFNKFFSMFDQRVAFYDLPSLNLFKHFFFQNRQFIPMVKALIKKSKTSDCVYTNIYLYCLSLVLLDSFEENEYSELGSRAIAMENTVQSTKKLIDALRLAYNKQRQSRITNDLVEIVSAAELLIA